MASDKLLEEVAKAIREEGWCQGPEDCECGKRPCEDCLCKARAAILRVADWAEEMSEWSLEKHIPSRLRTIAKAEEDGGKDGNT